MYFINYMFVQNKIAYVINKISFVMNNLDRYRDHNLHKFRNVLHKMAFWKIHRRVKNSWPSDILGEVWGE